MNTKKQLPLIIACDPSIVSSGFAIFKEGYLCATHYIKPKKCDDRLRDLVFKFVKLLGFYEKEYSEIVLAIETQYVHSGFGNSILKVAQVKGIMEGLFLYKNNMGKIMDISPSAAKKAIGVKGTLKRAEKKKAMKKAINTLFPLYKIENQDIVDAVAVGVAALQKIKE